MPLGRVLQLLFFALLSSHLLMAGVFLVIAKGNSTPPALPSQSWIYALLLIPAGIYSLSGWLGQRAIALAKDASSLAEKFAIYRGGAIVRWAMMEGAYIVILLLYYLSRDVVFLGAAAAGFIFYVMQAPSETRVCNDLRLSSDERAILRASHTLTK